LDFQKWAKPSIDQSINQSTLTPVPSAKKSKASCNRLQDHVCADDDDDGGDGDNQEVVVP